MKYLANVEIWIEADSLEQTDHPLHTVLACAREEGFRVSRAEIGRAPLSEPAEFMHIGSDEPFVNDAARRVLELAGNGAT